MAHVLVLGGTTMLEQVSQFLAERNNIVTVISRNAESLAKLPKELVSGLGKIIPVHLNYFQLDSLKQGLQSLYQKYGPITLALVRGRDQSGAVEDTVASFINSTSPICRLFHILDEQLPAGPVTQELLSQKFTSEYDRILYRRIVLAQAHLPSGETRDLPKSFVVDGVIQALQDDKRHRLISLEEGGNAKSMTA